MWSLYWLRCRLCCWKDIKIANLWSRILFCLCKVLLYGMYVCGLYEVNCFITTRDQMETQGYWLNIFVGSDNGLLHVWHQAIMALSQPMLIDCQLEPWNSNWNSNVFTEENASKMSSAKLWRFSAVVNVFQLVMDELARTQLALATLTTDVPRPPIAIIECGHMVECLIFFPKFSQ